jgi:hypothetical protein
MQYFLWGAWYVTLGSYILRNMGNDGTQVGIAFGATAIASSLTPFLMGDAGRPAHSGTTPAGHTAFSGRTHVAGRFSNGYLREFLCFFSSLHLAVRAYFFAQCRLVFQAFV